MGREQKGSAENGARAKKAREMGQEQKGRGSPIIHAFFLFSPHLAARPECETPSHAALLFHSARTGTLATQATIPYSSARTYTAHIWEYPPRPCQGLLAMLVFQTDPMGVDLFSTYISFCSSKFVWLLDT